MRSSSTAFFCFLGGLLSLGFLSGYASPVELDAPRLMAILILLLGSHLRGEAISKQPYLGRAWGPYKVIRHPQFAGEIACLVGLALFFGNWMGWVIAGSSLGYYVWPYEAIYREELFLLDTFPQYGEYASRTKRLIPGVF